MIKFGIGIQLILIIAVGPDHRRNQHRPYVWIYCERQPQLCLFYLRHLPESNGSHPRGHGIYSKQNGTRS